MPTGYTAAIADNISFEEFVMRCARSMGAMVTIQDLLTSHPAPARFDPSPYHKECLDKAADRLTMLTSMSEEAAEVEAKKEYQEELEFVRGKIVTAADLQHKYEAMLLKVRAWIPPTPNHERLRDSMIDQLNCSIDYDCDVSHYKDHPVKQKSGKDWLRDNIDQTMAEICRHAKGYEKEVVRTNERNDWLFALRDSLNIPA